MRHIPLIVILLLGIHPLIGQSIKGDLPVSLKFQNTPLNEVLDHLSEQYDIAFAYNAASLREIMVDIKAKKKPLQDVLAELLAGRGFDFKLRDQGVLISPSTDGSPGVRILDWSGMVKDSVSGEALPFASLFIPGLNRGTTTNADGYFLIQQVPDTAEVMIAYLGYRSKRLPLAEAMKSSTVQLQSKEEILPELLITTELEPMRVKDDPGHLTFNPRLLTGLPTMGEVDIMRSLQLLPGVAATNETSSGLVVRGSPPDQNLILFDGFSVFQLDHFFGVFSAFNHHAIKDIQLYRGGFDARYGGRTSSVLDITGKSGDSQGLRVGLNASLISVNGSLETPIGKKWTLLLAARRAFTDIIQSNLYKDLVENVRNDESNSPQKRLFNTQELEPTFYFWDYNLKLTFRPSPKDVLSLTLYQGRDNLVLQADKQVGFVNAGINDDAEWGNVGVSFRWARQWGKKWYSQARLSWSDYDYQIAYNTNFFYDDGNQTLEVGVVQNIFNDVGSGVLGFDTEWQVTPKYSMHFGANIEGLSTSLSTDNGDNNAGAVDQLIMQEGGLYSSYWQHYWDPLEKITLSAGIRHQYFDLLDQSLWDPRFGIQYRFLPKFTFKAAWGKYHQVTNRIINSDINNGIPDFWLLADQNTEILPKDSEHWVGGVLFKDGPWTVDVEGYYKTVDGLVDYVPLGRYFSTDVLPQNQFLAGSSKAKGVDILIQRDGKRYSGWIGYSLSRVDDLFPELNNNQEFPSNEDQRHEFKTVHLWELGKWKFSGTWIYATGKPFTAPQGFYQVQGVSSRPVTIFELTDVNSFRLPDYHRLDLSATYGWKWGSWKLESGLSIYNVYGRENTKFKRFEITYFDPVSGQILEVPQVVTFDVNMLGFTPNIFLNVKL